MTLYRSLYTCTFAGVKIPIWWVFVLQNELDYFAGKRCKYLYKYKICKHKCEIYMRYIYICIDISRRCFYIHVEDGNILKCSHHFCESRVGGCIKFSKEWCIEEVIQAFLSIMKQR